MADGASVVTNRAAGLVGIGWRVRRAARNVQESSSRHRGRGVAASGREPRALVLGSRLDRAASPYCLEPPHVEPPGRPLLRPGPTASARSHSIPGGAWAPSGSALPTSGFSASSRIGARFTSYRSIISRDSTAPRMAPRASVLPLASRAFRNQRVGADLCVRPAAVSAPAGGVRIRTG